MRFLDTPTIIFTDVNGNSYPVKDIRPISKFKTMMNLNVKTGDLPDEIMSRNEFYGAGGEDFAWALVDHNCVAFADANFDISKIKTLNIPVMDTY